MIGYGKSKKITFFIKISKGIISQGKMENG